MEKVCKHYLLNHILILRLSRNIGFKMTDCPTCLNHDQWLKVFQYFIIGVSDEKKKLIQNLNSLDTEEPMIELDTLNEDGSKQVIKESDYVKLQRMTKEIPHVCEKPTLYSTYHPKVS